MNVDQVMAPRMPPASPRVRAMLQDPILPTILRMSWPNMLMMLAQASTGLIEMWFLAKLGTDVLAGVAVVVPVLMLMQNMSQGALGGGISAAVARALGSGHAALADSLARHALVLSAGVGLVFTLLLPVCSTSWPGPWPIPSADGEYTRSSSNGIENLAPSSKAMSSTFDRLWTVSSVGFLVMMMLSDFQQ